MMAAVVLSVIAAAARAADTGDTGVLVAAVSEERIRGHVRVLAAAPRDGTAARRAAAAYVERQLASYGHVVTRVSAAGGETLVVRLGSTADARPVFLVGAHYDSVPGAPGADDNASGVAALLEIARLLAGRRPAAPIVLAAFDLEEAGFLGSTALAERLAREPGGVGTAYSLEMIGYTCARCQTPIDDVPGCLDVDTPVAEAGDFVALVVNDASLPLAREFVAAARRHVPDLRVAWGSVAGTGGCFPHARRSDHAPFWDRGVRAMMITDTADFRNPHYHRASDVPATLDYPFARRVTQAVLAAVLTATQ